MGTHFSKIRLCICLTGIALSLLCFPCITGAAEDVGENGVIVTAQSRPYHWYLSFGASNFHPRFQGVEKDVHNNLNDAIRLVVPTFNDARTFTDMRDSFLIWIPEISVGLALSPRWNVFVRTGYAETTLHTDANDTSIFLATLHSDVKLQTSFFFAGAGAACFPWDQPELREYDSIGERVRDIRPFISASANWVHIRADGDVKLAFRPIPIAFTGKRDYHWTPWEAKVAAGIRAPIGARTSLDLDIAYHVFSEHKDDMNGLSVGLALQWHF